MSAGDLRLCRLPGQDQRQALGLGHVPGTPCGAHGGLIDLQDPRAQHPHHFAGYRRRVRQQGRGLSGLHLRHRRIHRDRRSGEMDRGPDRESVHDRIRPRLSHDRQDRRDQGRDDHRPVVPCARGPRRVRCLCGSDQVSGRLLQHLHRILRHSGRLCRCRRRLYQQGARRRGLPLFLQGDGGVLFHRAHDRHPGAQAEDGSGGIAHEEFHPQGGNSPTRPLSAGNTIPAITTRR